MNICFHDTKLYKFISSEKKMTEKVAIIGAGIFGISAALEISKNYDTVLFEKEGNIFAKATGLNHYRHHHGYHYPRSKRTVLESIRGRISFEAEYGDCVMASFPYFYSIAKEGSVTSPEEYLRFCDEVGLPYDIVDPDPELINASRVAMTLKVSEQAFDPWVLKSICEEKLKDSAVDLKLNHKLVRGKILDNNIKRLGIEGDGKSYDEEFNYIVGATYANINQFNRALGLQPELKQYELMELIEVKIPDRLFGLINIDGLFTSIMPKGNKGLFTIAHTEESVLERIVSNNFNDDIESFGQIPSNVEKIMEKSILDFPIIAQAEYMKPFYITKIVKANVDDTDERPSEVTNYGNGIYSIFGGKIITAVDVAKEVSSRIKADIILKKSKK